MRKKILKFLAVLGVCSISLSITAQEILPASKVLEQAFVKAKKEKKNVFVMFTASWCINCHALKRKVLESPVLKNRNIFDENYVMCYLTALETDGKKHLENPGATQLYRKYTAKAEESVGIPFYVILSPEGKMLGDAFYRSTLSKEKQPPLKNIGRPAMFDEIYAFVDLLKNTSSLNEGQLSYLAKYLSVMPSDYFKLPE